MHAWYPSKAELESVPSSGMRTPFSSLKKNTDEETWLSVKVYIFEFGIEAYSEVVQNQIKDTERQLRRSNIVLRNMVSKNDRYHQSIARAETYVYKCKLDIY